MARLVSIVFDSDFGEQLEKLAFRCPVWIVDTPDNLGAAEGVWTRIAEWPHISVTMFRQPETTFSRGDWRRLLDQISFQEKSVETVDVIGTALTPSARAAFADEGLEHFTETDTGFKASKRHPTFSGMRG
ncbi:MAG: hypothetical protein WA208_03675 [Thermoanaerobaculia bacterium]